MVYLKNIQVEAALKQMGLQAGHRQTINRCNFFQPTKVECRCSQCLFNDIISKGLNLRHAEKIKKTNIKEISLAPLVILTKFATWIMINIVPTVGVISYLFLVPPHSKYHSRQAAPGQGFDADEVSDDQIEKLIAQPTAPPLQLIPPSGLRVFSPK